MRYANCHPDRKHAAKGLCSGCYQRQWISSNRPKWNKLKLAWAKRNPEYTRRNAKLQYHKRKELGTLDYATRRKNNSNWKKNNRDMVANQVAKYRAKKRGARINDFTHAQWKLMKTLYKDQCFYCESNAPLTQDHLIPISRGGNHTSSNIVPACALCNSTKNNKTIVEYVNTLHLSKLNKDLLLFRTTQW